MKWKDVPWTAVATMLSVSGVVFAAFVNKWLSERQFERKSQAEEFTDILDRFASENPIMRANAAIRLGEMAYRRSDPPSRSAAGAELPFFSRTIAQLAAALHMEEHSAVRAEIGRALTRIANEASDAKGPQLVLLVHEIAGANRQAKASMSDHLARALACSADQVQAPARQALCDITRFCAKDRVEETDWAQLYCLNQLIHSDEYASAVAVHGALRPSQGEKSQLELSEQLVMDIAASAERLRDARVALARVLRYLPAPQDLPPSWKLPTWQEDRWQRRPRVIVDRCFLAGLRFEEAHLEGISFDQGYAQGSNFRKAHMQGISLSETGLHGADLTNADLRGADLYFVLASHANFLGAKLQNARLQDAILRNAKLFGAELEQANLREAKLDEADLTNANFRDADLSGAVLRGANLTGANLCNATVEGDEFGKHFKADFTGANWWDARFWELSPRLVDRQLPVWLQANFPTAAENVARLDRWLENPHEEYARQHFGLGGPSA